jgi:hypothetical protein
VGFFIGEFMDKTLLGIFIGSGTTLLGVGLTSLFNYLTKRKELKHNEHLKELDLKDREKERKFKIEEKMIEHCIESLQGLFNFLRRIGSELVLFEQLDKKHLDSEEGRERCQKRIKDILFEVEKWLELNSIFLPGEIKNEFESLLSLLQQEFIGCIPPDVHDTIWKKLNEQLAKTSKSIEQILKEYNPFYDRKIR